MYCRHAFGRGLLACFAAGLSCTVLAFGSPAPVRVKTWQELDKEVAARFAPAFYQGMAGTGRFDYITNFDFDGDWIGDNNWAHAADKKYPLNGHIYFSLTETTTHYFIHYAVFHPRDWKGGEIQVHWGPRQSGHRMARSATTWFRSSTRCGSTQERAGTRRLAKPTTTATAPSTS